MSDHTKTVVLQYVEAFNRGDVDAVCQLFAPNAVVYGVLGWGGLETVRPIWQEIMSCFSIHLRVDSIVAEREMVAVRYTESGKSVQPFRGALATGRAYEIVAMEWFEVRDGLIQRRWGARDMAAQFKQMGLALH
jgi:steroid delta-isomerase-like uncharacterized protein